MGIHAVAVRSIWTCVTKALMLTAARSSREGRATWETTSGADHSSVLCAIARGKRTTVSPTVITRIRTELRDGRSPKGACLNSSEMSERRTASGGSTQAVSYTHLRAHETRHDLV